jgi:hypothetical protein
LRWEISNAHAFIYNIGQARTDDDMKDSLDEQIEWLRVRQETEVERLRQIDALLKDASGSLGKNAVEGQDGGGQIVSFGTYAEAQQFHDLLFCPDDEATVRQTTTDRIENP